MMLRRLGAVFALIVLILLPSASCTDTRSRARAVFVLLDVSGTYVEEIQKAQRIVDYLLAVLNPGDSLAVARIDSASFSEKDIIASVTFSSRPSMANSEKRAYRLALDKFARKVKRSGNTDISGAMLQALGYLDETGAHNRYLFVFSDLQEDLKRGHIRQWDWNFNNTHVVAVNVTKLASDNIDPRAYLDRVAAWQAKVEKSGGQWRMINDLAHVEQVLR